MGGGPQISIDITAEESDAAQALTRVYQQQRNLENQTRRNTRASREWSDAGRRVSQSFRDIAIGAIGISSINQVISEGIDLLNEYGDGLDRISKVQRTEAEKLQSFLTVQPPGKEGQEWVSEILTWAADNLAMKPSDAAAFIEPAQSALNVGDISLTEEEKKAIKETAEQAGSAVILGAPSDQAVQTEVIGQQKGYAAGAATGLALTASGTSILSKEQFFTAAPTAQQAPDLESGFAVISALSNAVAPEEMKTYAQKAFQVLSPAGEKGKLSGFTKEFGLEGLTMLEKVHKLGWTAVTEGDQSLPEDKRIDRFIDALYSKLEQREARAIGGLIRNYDTFYRVEGQLRGLESPETIPRQMVSDIMAYPGQESAFVERQGEAMMAANALFGTTSDIATAESAARRSAGIEAAARGAVWGIDPETGSATRGRRKYEAARRGIDAGEPGMFPEPGVANEPSTMIDYVIAPLRSLLEGLFSGFMSESSLNRGTGDEATEALREANKNLADAIRENTRAVTERTGGGRAFDRDGNI